MRDTSVRLPPRGVRDDYRPTHACPQHVDAPSGGILVVGDPRPVGCDGGEQEAPAREALHDRHPPGRRQEEEQLQLRPVEGRQRQLEPAGAGRRRARPVRRPPGRGGTARPRAPQGRRRPGRAGPGDRARRGRLEQRHRPGRRSRWPTASAGSSARWSWSCPWCCSSPPSGCSAAARTPRRGGGWRSAGCARRRPCWASRRSSAGTGTRSTARPARAACSAGPSARR